MSEARRGQVDASNLRQPGWLPTAIVVNIVKPDNMYRGACVDTSDIVDVVDAENQPQLLLPQTYDGSKWEPKGRYPIEIIDGQHRLFAFNETFDDFEVPVVAFHGLDIGWQAYLFWTINIKPKRINASLAFDLYPLLRTQDWLEQGEDYSIYRETRAQELTEKLWSYPKSVWNKRIDMVGNAGRQFVSQAAWVRSFVATIIKRWDGKGVSIGGLFGSKMSDGSDPLPWSRIQQAAFIISFWNQLLVAIASTKSTWVKALRTESDPATVRFNTRSSGDEPAFFGPHTLINQDQGIRAILHVLNDVFFVSSERLALEDWIDDRDDDLSDDVALAKVIRSFSKTDAYTFMETLCESLARYDWRSSTAPGLSEEQSQMRRLFRGSGGYAELRRQCVEHLTTVKQGPLRAAAMTVLDKMRSAR